MFKWIECFIAQHIVSSVNVPMYLKISEFFIALIFFAGLMIFHWGWESRSPASGWTLASALSEQGRFCLQEERSLLRVRLTP